jgi:hypothetical protein
MKYNTLRFALLMFLIASCSSSPESSARPDIITWAKQIAHIENQLEQEVSQAKPLIDRITSRLPTQDEIDQLFDYSNRITSLYNEIVGIETPLEARSVHEKYVENYAEIANSVRYYVLALKMNDLTYFDKSVTAAQEANRIGAEAYTDFESLLNKYSISCEEIDFCQ